MATSIISPHGGVNKLAKISLDTVTNTSGSYTHTTTVADITPDHKVLSIECGNNDAFLAPIVISTDTDSITLSCDNVVGTSTVIAYVQMAGDNLVANSLEYGAISTRVGNLSDLTTSDKSSIVNSINSNSGKNVVYAQSFAHGQTQLTVPLANVNYVTFILAYEYMIKAVCTVPTAVLLLNRWTNNTGTFQINMHVTNRNYITCQMSGTNLLIKDFETGDSNYANQIFVATTR